MKSVNIINRHIFRELLSPFAISLSFLTFVFLMTRIPEITNMVVNYNANLWAILVMVVFTLPRFMEFTIPMSVMISVLLTFMRMSGENEIVALKGAGVSLYRLVPPVLAFCLMGTLLTMWLTVFGVPWGRLSFKQKSLDMARSSINLALQERQFNSELSNIMIYVASVEMKTRELKDVFIEDRRTPGVTSISAAPSGKLLQMESERIYTIRLYNGMINQVNKKDNSVSNINFGQYDINIDLGSVPRGGTAIRKELGECSLAELYGRIQKGFSDKAGLSEALMIIHEKFSIPFACLALGILALPLGIQAQSLRRSSGFGMGIFFFLLYYFLLAGGWSAGETGHYPPAIGMWLPNVIMGGAGVYLLQRNVKEKPVHLPGWVNSMALSVKNRFFRKRVQ